MANVFPPIQYTLSFPAPHSHYVEVEARIPAVRLPESYPVTGDTPVKGDTTGEIDEQLDVWLPVWTPGSYLVREYSRHIENLRAESANGRPLLSRKTRKNRWHIEADGEGLVILRYEVYCHEMSVRSNWVEEGFALINGAATFLTTEEPVNSEHRVTIRIPEGWEQAICALPRAGDSSREATFVAVNYDELVDSPLYAGSGSVYKFRLADRNHLLVNEGEGDIWDGQQSADDVEKIVATQHEFWGCVPYDRYVFFNLITESGGGLEHKNSTVLMTSRWKSRVRKSYLEWLGLVSHEFFHTWNVKRLRPVELGPFEYEKEVYTRSLWVAEGITNYYTDLLVHRAGLCSEAEYLEKLSKFIERLQTTPGRSVQSLEDSSFDAWIKLYRPDENSINTAISYYVKGAVVAFLLDAKIRHTTESARSLDDVMRRAYEAFSGEQGFSGEAFCQTAVDVAGEDFSDWFETALRSTEELDYSETLDWLGLRFKESPGKRRDGESNAEHARSPRAYVGIGTKNEAGRLMISQVRRETPGWRAGLNARDEIIAIGGYRVLPGQWEKRLEQYKPGDRISFLVSRRETMLSLDVEFDEKPSHDWALEIHPDASPSQTEHRNSWLLNANCSSENRHERSRDNHRASARK